MSFDVGGLRGAGGEQSAVSAACHAVREALTDHGIKPSSLGSVPAAAAFHTAVRQAMERQSADAEAEAARRSELAGRASRTSQLGAQLVADTSRVAATAVPGLGAAAEQ